MDAILLLGLAALFLAAGVSKALGRRQFGATVGAYRLVPRGVADPLAGAVITGEITGALLAVGPAPWGQIGLVVLAAIAGTGAFLATVDLLLDNADHACGCLSQDTVGRLQWWHPVRGAIVATTAAALAVPGAPTASARPWAVSVLLVVALAVAWATLLATVSLRRERGPHLSSSEVGR